MGDDMSGKAQSLRHLRFFKFIMDEIFPGGRQPTVPMIEEAQG